MYIESHPPPLYIHIRIFTTDLSNYPSAIHPNYHHVQNFNYNVAFPSAKGIELILLGGMSPTSVTTAVMYVGGVKSYNGFSISRFCPDGTVFRFEFRRVIVRGTFDIRIISNTQ